MLYAKQSFKANLSASANTAHTASVQYICMARTCDVEIPCFIQSKVSKQTFKAN